MGPAADVMGKLLQGFLLVLSVGYTTLQGEVWWLFAAFATLELVACGLLWAWSESGVVEHLIWKVLAISVTSWLIGFWPTLIEGITKGFVKAGLLAAGQQQVWTLADFYNPGNIVTFGWGAVAVVFTQFNRTTGFQALASLPYLLTAGVAAWGVVVCYMLVAIAVFLAIVEFYFVSVVALFLLPFGLFRHTAFLAQGVFSMVGSHAVRLLVLAFLTGVTLPIMYTLKLPTDPQFQDVLVFFFASLTLLVLVWQAPTLANGLVFGYPTLHAGHALGMAAQSASTLALVTRGAAAIPQGLYQGALGATSGFHALREAAHIGAATYRQQQPGASGLASSLRGGSQGVAQFIRQRTFAGFREAAAQGRLGATNILTPPTPNGTTP